MYTTINDQTRYTVSFVYDITAISSNTITATINHTTTGGGFSLIDVMFLY